MPSGFTDNAFYIRLQLGEGEKKKKKTWTGLIYKNMHTNLLARSQAAAWIDRANMAAVLIKEKTQSQMHSCFGISL